MKFYAIVAALGALSCIGLQTATAFEVEYAAIRMTPWINLTSAQKLAASNLGYTEKEWNNPGTEESEKATWDNSKTADYYDKDGDGNYEDVVPFEVYASQLGFTGENAEDMWDCWVNHYNYYWEDIVDYGLLPAITALGWTEEMWNSDGALKPKSDDLDWWELSTAEKTAAVVFCYVKPLWDEKSLWDMCDDSPRDFRLNKKAQKSCDWVSQDLARCNLKKNGLFTHCRNTCGSCDDKCWNSSLKWKLKVKKNKTIFKRCKYTEKNKVKKCSKPGMKETCPEQCDPCPP